MKKSLLALAVLSAFAGLASAQSSVTVYGILDANLGKDAGSDDDRMFQGAGSRLGFRGSEDLGGGLRANFAIEHRFVAATGNNGSNFTNAATNPFWGGMSQVGLSGGFGAVWLGRQYTTTFLNGTLIADPWGFDTVAQNTVILTGGIEPVRWASAITYNSPSFSGFKFSAQVAEGDKNPPAVGTAQDIAYNLIASYGAGPIYAAVGFIDPSGANDDAWFVQGSYNFGFAKFGAFYGNGTTNANLDRTNYLVTATAPIGAGELRASWGKLEGPMAAGLGDANLREQFGIGYFYSLSKRTTIYADFVQAKTDVPTGLTNPSNSLSNGKKKDEGYDLGIKHTF